MTKATFNGKVIAESGKCEEVEGNKYFPPESIKKEFFRESSTRTTCPWKGEAHYYDLEVDGKTAKDAAWTYPGPSDAARKIKDHVAFYTDKVEITE